MYFCKSCNRKFKNPLTETETHKLASPPFEAFSLCPFCKSTDFEEIAVSHCRCCGARIINKPNGFCSDKCRNQFEKLHRAEYKRKKELGDSPIYLLLREVDAYNKKHGTKYSYGQYVAFIKTPEKRKRCKAKKNI